MAWSMGGYDAENWMAIINGTCKSKEPIGATLAGYPLGGFEDSGTMASSKRSFCSYLSHQDEALSEDDVADEISPGRVEKKRRLTAHQVKSLETSFEMENKLEPERKQKLANDLGLQPRQVAIWFQNRRARWKTKRLEQDYDSLRFEFDALLLDRDTLRAEVKRLTKELEGREQDKKGNAVETQDEEAIVHEERQHLRKDENESKKTFQIFNQESPAIQCDTCNEKETSLYSDQTDTDSSFQCATMALQDDNTFYSDQLIKVENTPSPSLHTNRYVFEQIGQYRMDDSSPLADQYYLGLYTTDLYDFPWLWFN